MKAPQRRVATTSLTINQSLECSQWHICGLRSGLGPQFHWLEFDPTQQDLIWRNQAWDLLGCGTLICSSPWTPTKTKTRESWCLRKPIHWVGENVVEYSIGWERFYFQDSIPKIALNLSISLQLRLKWKK